MPKSKNKVTRGQGTRNKAKRTPFMKINPIKKKRDKGYSRTA